jgi:hypothetical protein
MSQRRLSADKLGEIQELRAAVMSEDERLARFFFAQRPGNPYRRRKTG